MLIGRVQIRKVTTSSLFPGFVRFVRFTRQLRCLNCALTFQRKIVTLQMRALRLIYFSKSKEYTVLFFLQSNYLPLPSLFFRDCSYLLYDINRQTAPVSVLNHNYRTRPVSSESFYVKFSRTDKMYAFFSRIGAQICWNSIPYSIKLLKSLSSRKKIKEL